MNHRPSILLFVLALVVVGLMVAGGIAWVHYYYLPQGGASPATASPVAATTTAAFDNTVVPSPETAAAMTAIQNIISPAQEAYFNAVTIPRTLQPASSAVYLAYSYKGYIFDAPWKGAVTSTVKGNPPAFVDEWFSNGRRVTLMEAQNSDSSTLTQWASVSSTIRTEYDLESAAFNSAPDQVVSSTPGTQAALTSLLLNIKTLLFNPEPVYSFNTGVVKGFQFGNASTTHQIVVKIFNESGVGEFNLIVSGTQGEIDAILASIRVN